METMRDRHVNNHQKTAMQHLISSDEAPDTGDDSDEDLITSYLGGVGGHFQNNNDPENNGEILQSIHLTPQSPNSNHILEDNLLQLAEIHENIQRMRLENAAAAANSGTNNSIRENNRLSTSCPSLNKGENQDLENGNRPTPTSRNPQQRRKGHPLSNIRGTNLNQAHFMHQSVNSSSGGSQYRSKRHGRKRSTSVSSGDSDDNSYGSQSRHQSRHASVGGHSGGVDFVDGGFFKSRPKSASSANNDSPKLTSYQSHGQKSVFKSPPDVSKMALRPPRKASNIFNQFPALHKSISTPSIAVEHQHGEKGERHKQSGYPEPTHVFLQKLISEHEWTRKSVGSETDTDDELRLSEKESRRGQLPVKHIQQRLINEQQVQQSPPISLAEFLQDAPSLDDDDQRKRRRKKERSSIFFRKKKDKSGPSSKSSSSFYPSHYGFDTSKNLAKVPSAVSLSSSKNMQQHLTKIPHHSYSMSSLRKPVSGTMSAGNASFYPHQHIGGNFYVAKGELRAGNDDRDDFGAYEDTQGLIESEYIPGEEFPEGGPAAIRNLETDPFLRIQEKEPESWQQAWKLQMNGNTGISTESVTLPAGMTKSEVKRQEQIYEFILTEKNHCQLLKLVQKIFLEGMHKYLNMNREVVDRIFPCIDELLQLHFRFLEQLRVRQNEQPVVESIADILLEQFSGVNGQLWKEAYGTICSQHNEAVAVYKDVIKGDRRFQQFIKLCSENPLLKKRELPACITMATSRITKYPLLIDQLIKSARDLPQEQQMLRDANVFIKDILKGVNSKVAEKEREQRFLDIYKSIDAKSSVQFQGRKFKKSDILSSARKLMFEGNATLIIDRNRSVQITVVILSDILFFLQENNQKYYFFSIENKPSVIPVYTLLAREKSGPSTKALQIVSTSETSSVTYDIEIYQPPTREDWINGIRDAVDACPSESDSETGLPPGTTEKITRMIDAKYMRMRHLTADLRGKDIELARLLEDKMRVMSDILVVLGAKDPFKDNPPDYVSLIREKDTNCTKEQLLTAVQEASRLASSLYSSGSGLSRSVSSAGERHSANYTSPSVPKRAETFGGFDQPQQPQLRVNPTGDSEGNEQSTVDSGKSQEDKTPLKSKAPGEEWKGLPSVPPLLSLETEQQEAAVAMTHHLNNLMCMVSEHFTSLESLKAEVSEIRERSMYIGGRYKQNQQLEELKALQEKMARDKRAWQLEKEAAEQEMEAQKRELSKLQTEVDRGLKDVKEQRDQLYRKLDLLKAQGIEIMGPNMSVLKTDIPASSSSNTISQGELLFKNENEFSNVSPTATVNLRRPSSVSNTGLHPSASNASSSSSSSGTTKRETVTNLNLLSTTNEAKVGAEKLEIKQQIPVKLSSKLSVSGGSGSKDKSKKISSVLKQNPLTSTSSLSGSMGNIAKPLMESSVQQMLPFKLSEPSDSGKKASPKFGYQRLVSTGPTSNSEYQKMTPQETSPKEKQLEVSHQRTGSSPALIPPSPTGRTPTNLPKSSSMGARDVPTTVNYGNNEDKVIYF